MTTEPTEPKPPAVTDLTTPPRGVLPKNAGTWLMVGIAVVMLIVIVASPPTPPPEGSVDAPTNTAGLIPSPEQLKDFEQKLRGIDRRTTEATARTAQNLSPAVGASPPRPIYVEDEDRPRRTFGRAGMTGPAVEVDPNADERQRKEYESLFASNLVLSRRPDAQQQMSGANLRPIRRDLEGEAIPAVPTLDEVTQSVVKAMGAAAPTLQQTAAPAAAKQDAPAPTTKPPQGASTPPPAPGLHRVFEGTVIDSVLATRLDGSMEGPVNCLVTNPVYAQDMTLVIPAGARVLGTARAVQAFGDSRLAVGFHRIVLPNGRDVPLDDFVGLNMRGDVGLRDQVNRHLLSTLGAGGAVGLLAGFAQWMGTGFSRNSNGGTMILMGNAGDAASQATAQTMARYLNRMPTITIREGHRVKVYLTGDLDLPVYREIP